MLKIEKITKYIFGQIYLVAKGNVSGRVAPDTDLAGYPVSVRISGMAGYPAK